MSTVGRINKSTIKFVPKRKAQPIHPTRAPSATPSLSGTPRNPKDGALPLPSVPDDTEREDAGEAGLSSANNQDQQSSVPSVPSSQTNDTVKKGPAPVPIQPGSTFGPSDPTQPDSSQSQPPSSLGVSFGPRDPENTQATSVYSQTQQNGRTQTQSSPQAATNSSNSPTRSPKRKAQGTAFTVSAHGPQAPSFAPPAPAPTSSATPVQAPARVSEAPDSSSQPAPIATTSTRSAFDNLAAAARVIAHADRRDEEQSSRSKKRDRREEEGSPEHDDDQQGGDETHVASTSTAPVKRLPASAKARVRGRGKGKEPEAESAPVSKEDQVEAARLKRLENKNKRDAKKKGKAPLGFAAAPPTVARNGFEARSENDEVAREARAGSADEPELTPDVPKRKRGRPVKVVSAAQAVDPEADGDPTGFAPARSAKAKGKQRVVGSEVESDSGDEPPMPKKPRRRAALKAKKSNNDWLFNMPSDEDAESAASADEYQPGSTRARKSTRKDAAISGDDDDDDSEHSDNEDEPDMHVNGRIYKGKGKRRKKRSDAGKSRRLAEIVVDPATTLMADIATGNDLVQGRESKRGKKLAKTLAERAQKKQAEKLKEKRHRDRRILGIPSDTEDDGDKQEEAQPEDGEDEPAADPGADQNGSRQVSPAVVQATSPVGSRQGSETPNLLEQMLARTMREGSGAEGSDDEEDGSGSGSDDERSDGYEELKETNHAAQVRVVNGKLVIDEDSLQVDRVAEAQRAFGGIRERIEESALDKMVNSATWGKHKPTERWTDPETDLFYKGVHQFGTDFEMIAGLFPYRSRQSIKQKWNREDRLHPERITAAMMHKKPIDLVEYAKITKQDLSGPVPEDPMDKIKELREQQALLEANGGAGGRPLPRVPKKRSASVAELDAGASDDVRAALARVDEDAASDEEEDDEEEEEDPLAALEAEEARQRAIEEEIAAAEEA